MSHTVRTAALVLSLVALSHASYIAGRHWWLHALHQPVVLAQVVPRQPAAVTVVHTGVPVPVLVSMSTPVAR